MQADNGSREESSRHVLFLTGVESTSTRAVAQSLSLLGMARSVPDADAGNSDAKDPVAEANDAALSALQRDWRDGKAITLPEAEKRTFAMNACAKLLRTELETAPELALWDPRVSLLTPIWLDAARQSGARSSFFLVLSDPAASASTAMHRHGLNAEAAVALWLRYTLDAELHSRGHARFILQTDAFAEDPVASLTLAGAALGLLRPEAKGMLRENLESVAASSVPTLSEAVQSTLLGLARETHEVLARGADLPGAVATLDRLRAEFDGAKPETMSKRPGNPAIEPQKTRTPPEAKNARNPTGDHPQSGSGTEEIDTVLAQLDDANDTVAALLAEARDLLDKFDRASTDLEAAHGDLARARRRPMKTLRDYLEFKALTGLSKASPPLPARMAQRFARSAAKRNPGRSLWQDSELAGPDSARSARPSSVTGSTTYHSGRAERDPNQSDILVVSHDSSRTGAPILALNLVRVLSRRYNVTTLCLQGGELLTDFRDHSVAVWGVGKRSDDISFHASVLGDVMAGQCFAFAVANSVESRHMLPPLRAHGVPNVILLHEFASYTLPKSAYPNAISWADQIVFSTHLTLDNAVETHHLTRTPTMHVVPQGKCEVPSLERLPAEHKLERDRLSELFRPNGHSSRRFIVIGAGYVQIRKGVDLFIDTAMRVLSHPDGKNAVFFWIGAGYDPDADFAYSVYLQDQLRRAGLTERVLMLSETSEIETVYSLADVLILTSRLDPLPNVAIDAMCAGLPVLCFDRTTGIAETLGNAGLKDACVAGYLDTSDLAEKIIGIATSNELHDKVTEKIRNYAAAAFDFEAYAERIETIALNAGQFDSLREDDIQTIFNSGGFKPDFCLEPKAQGLNERDGISLYVDRIRSGVDARKPEPGFHPYIFAEQMDKELQEGADPYAEFLRRGRPTGPWMLPVITGAAAETPTMKPAQTRAALHIHAYYTDQLRDIVQRLEHNAARPDLFISVADDAGARAARKYSAEYSGKVASVEVMPNMGRDIGPLLTGFGEDLIRDYDVVGHVHTKKSMHLEDVDTTKHWVEFAYSGCLGGKRPGPMVDHIFDWMARDDRTGIVYPDDPNILGWTKNLGPAKALAESFNLGTLPEVFNFPIGTMFWMRSEVLKPFVDLGLTWADYPCEPVPSDGTMLHALERLFGIVPQLQGWQTVVTNIPSTTR